MSSPIWVSTPCPELSVPIHGNPMVYTCIECGKMSRFKRTLDRKHGISRAIPIRLISTLYVKRHRVDHRQGNVITDHFKEKKKITKYSNPRAHLYLIVILQWFHKAETAYINVDSTLYRWINVDTALLKRSEPIQ